MMKKLEISADIKNVKSTFREIESLAKSATRRPQQLKLFDKKELDTLKDWAKKQLPEVKKDLQKLKHEMKEMSDVNLLLKTKQQANELEKQLKKLEKLSLGKIPSGERPGLMARLGIGGGPGAAGGLLGGVGAGTLALGGGALALGGLAISRMMSGYQQRMGEVEPRLGLAGAMGVGRYRGFTKGGGPYSGAQYGFDVNQTLSQANLLVRETTSLRQLGRTQRFGRAYGIGPEELAGQAGVMRRMGGIQNVDKNFTHLLSSSIASDLDQSLIGEYLKVTSEFIEQIATEGTPDIKEMTRAMSGLVRQGGIYEDSRRAAKALGGLHQSIQSSQGAKFGFFAQAFEGMLGPGAAGTDVLLALNQGLFGANTSRLTAISPEERTKLGLGGAGFKRRAGAITGQFDDLTKGMDVSGKALIASQLTGISDAAEAYNFMNALKQGKFSETEMEKKYKEAKASPEERAIMDLGTLLDKRLADVEAASVNSLSKLGEQVAPSMADIKSTLLDIEGATLLPILQQLTKHLGPMTKGISDLVKHFVGDEKPSETMTALADLASGGRVSYMKNVVAKKGEEDLLFQLQKSGADKPLESALSSLYQDVGSLNEVEARRIQKGMEKATKAQKETIKEQAWEKSLMTTLDVARARKEGKPLDDEGTLLESIRQAKKFIPEGTLPKGPLSDEILKTMQREGLGTIAGQISEETGLSRKKVGLDSSIKFSDEALQMMKKVDADSSRKQGIVPSMPGTQGLPKVEEKQSTSNLSPEDASRLIGALQDLSKKTEDNTRATDNSSKSVVPNQGVNIYKYRPGGSGQINTRRGS